MSFQMKFRASDRLVAPPLICFEQLVGTEEQIYGVEIPEGADSFGSLYYYERLRYLYLKILASKHGSDISPYLLGVSVF